MVGSQFLVTGASDFARFMGMSEWAIGITIVAAGTSTPELVTCLSAVLKGRHGISAGALIGSDLYNILGVLGTAVMIRPLAVNEAGIGSVWLLLAGVTFMTVFLRTGWKISRLGGPYSGRCRRFTLVDRPGGHLTFLRDSGADKIGRISPLC